MSSNDNSIIIQSARLILTPLSDDEIGTLIEETKDEELKQAYSEMLKGCLDYPEKRIWYAPWKMALKTNTKELIGDLCFKGIREDGSVEIGYGIHPEFEGQGLMSEAVDAMVKWAFTQNHVSKVLAETDPDNKASQRILEKAGFVPLNIMGEEGPIFELRK